MSKIYITQRNNDKYFNQKLPTLRNGFTYINRKITFVPDPNGVYDEGEWGYFVVNGQKVYVHSGDGDSFEIWK
jgi:hypothetical protein